jgi:hypothetical protein
MGAFFVVCSFIWWFMILKQLPLPLWARFRFLQGQGLAG